MSLNPQFDVSSPVTPYNQMQQGAIQPDFNFVAINWYPNRYPLAIRLPKKGLGSLTFTTFSDPYRAGSQLMNQGGTLADNGTSLTVTDGSQFTPGDIIEIETEQIRITAVSSNTLTITRGFGGTTAAAHTDGRPVYTLGRATTGAEQNLAGMSCIPQPYTQYAQTIQHAYSVGGAMASVTNYFASSSTPLDRDRQAALNRVMDDRERTLIYGAGQAYTAPNTVQQAAGFRKLCVTNKTLSPTSASAYKPSDLIRDTLQKVFDSGGDPSVLFVSTDWLSGLSTWGLPFQRLEVGETAFGVKVHVINAPFLGNIDVIPCPVMRAGSALCLSGAEAFIREKRVIHEKPRGSLGDVFSGDVIWEGAPELENESHHAWVSGITGFAAP